MSADGDAVQLDLEQRSALEFSCGLSSYDRARGGRSCRNRSLAIYINRSYYRRGKSLSRLTLLGAQSVAEAYREPGPGRNNNWLRCCRLRLWSHPVVTHSRAGCVRSRRVACVVSIRSIAAVVGSVT